MAKEWGYGCTNNQPFLNPSEWYKLYENDTTEKRQSPIDIRNENIEVMDDTRMSLRSEKSILFSGECLKIQFETKKTGYQWNVQSNNSTCKITYNKKSYSLIQFHLHTPAEHFINGSQQDIEVHFVHQLDIMNDSDKNNTEFLVIGLFLTKDEKLELDNPWITSIFQPFHQRQSHDIYPIE